MRQNSDIGVCIVILVAVHSVKDRVQCIDGRNALQGRCGILLGLCFKPLIEHCKFAVDLCNECSTVIQHSSVIIVIPQDIQAKRFSEKAYRNIGSAAFLVRCGVNFSGFECFSGLVVHNSKLLAAECERKRLSIFFCGNGTGIIAYLSTKCFCNGAERHHDTAVYLFGFGIGKADILAVQLYGELLAHVIVLFVNERACHITQIVITAVPYAVFDCQIKVLPAVEVAAFQCTLRVSF